ncbi:MAG: hypothetical protein ACTIK1_05425, partial [Glutamicibacter arilaitensis]|uniref:hypothetical protein n=1 Tax=Glutamicibacter arilaitensis TaxID=256701 RepID=UPI003FD2BE04
GIRLGTCNHVHRGQGSTTLSLADWEQATGTHESFVRARCRFTLQAYIKGFWAKQNPRTQ